MKNLFLFLSVLLVASNVSAQKEEAVRVVVDDWQQLIVEFNVNTLKVGTTTIDGETFSTLAIDGYEPSLSSYGNPALPLFSRMIEVPLDAKFKITVSDVEYDTLPTLEHWLAPVQLPRSKSDTAAPRLYINLQGYSTDTFFAEQEMLVEPIGIARDRRLARLQFSPVRYNPVSGQLIVCRHATVTVTYRGGDREASVAMFERYHSPAFNSGANPLNNLYPKAVRTTAPVRMVIVANSMFRGHLDTFVQWKQKKGFLTDIVYTDNPAVGTTTTSIAAYLKGLYDYATTAEPAPTYVLLVGDVGQLPAFDAQVTSPDNDHVTDLYYSTWTTGDHLPDCHYGRFSAQTVAQLTPQVLKTLMYEQYTFADPTFLDRAVMVAGVDGGNAGDYGYTHADPAMDYAITHYVNGTQGWSQVMYFKNDVTIIPSCTTNVTIGSSASSNSATVRSYYNQGAGFINYSAHGGSTGWGTPSFNNNHVNQMTNNQKFGLMIGNCCLTNKFEESTCFGEALLRKGNYAGAVGYIGGSNSTYWGQDFYWAVGIRSSIGPTMSMVYDAANLGVYDRTFHTHGETYSQWCTTQGSMVMQGNMAVENSSTSSSMKHYYWESYHLMGDPSVMPYMTQAAEMPVTVASVVNYGTVMLPVMAVPNAYIALVDTVTGSLITAKYADGSGSDTLVLPAELPVGTYLLAASAQQYRTTFRTINVIQPSGPFPMVTDITSAPFNAGDTVALTLRVENPGNETARNITIQLESNSPNLSFIDTLFSVLNSQFSFFLDSLVAGASIDLTAIVSTYVAEDVVDGSFVDISTSAIWTDGASPATNVFRKSIFAPVLSISFSPANPSVMPDSATTITATLRNNGHAPAHPGTLFLSSPTSLLSLYISPDSISHISVPALSPLTTDTQFSIFNFQFSISADAQMPQDIFVPVTYSFGSFGGEYAVFTGQSFLETFEGGHTNVSGWDVSATYPWVISTEQPWQGSYCLRSAQNLGHNQQSDMSIAVTVAAADSVSFYYRVSSESDYDKFFFLVDGVEQFNASGDLDWERASFPLSVGSHTLTFRYKKDYSISRDCDCAWIDNVILPYQTHSAIFLQRDTCILSIDSVSSTILIDSTQKLITLIDYAVHPSYILVDEISACDRYQWQGQEYTETTFVGDSLLTTYGCDSIEGHAFIINHSSVGDTLFVTTQAENYEWNGTVYESSGTYLQVLTSNEGCDSLVTLVLTLGIQGINDIQQSTSSIQLYPNPTTGALHFSQQIDAVMVYDLTGRVVSQEYRTDVVDLHGLPSGIYTLYMTCSETTVIQRVVKQ